MDSNATTRRAVIYARLSVASDESVSIERQVEAARQYAAARGWQVVADPFLDDGISATHNKPEDRKGWRALLGSSETFDAVIVWKVDRLARRVLDFLHADEDLQERGAGIVAVEQTIDMTTPEGRGFATMLAVFGEMEAAAISARVKAARDYLLKAGRVVGGTIPYGWQSIPNPDGKGFVLAHHPERIEWVRGMAERALRGNSIYSITQWLSTEGAPLPETSQTHRRGDGWNYSTVERLLRNPLLAGMTTFNPGNRAKARGTEVLRDEHGLPVVDESVAIMPVAEWRLLVRMLDERDTPQSKPRALKSKTSALLSGLVRCGDCAEDDGRAVRMWRSNIQKRPGYYCPQCRQSITRVDERVIAEFLSQKGERTRWSLMREVHEGGAALLPEIEQRLDELDTAIRQAATRDERQHLQAQQANLLDLRDEKRAEPSRVKMVPVRGTQTFGEDWAAAEGVEEQRAVLDDALVSVTVVRGRRGGPGLDPSRLRYEWKEPMQLGPEHVPTDAELAQWAEENPYGR